VSSLHRWSMSHWWKRRCGGQDVLRLAVPLVISTCFWTVMSFTDQMFLLWHSNTAMAAAMPAGLLHFTVLCIPFGIVTYLATFVAQYHGAGRPGRIGLVLWQGVWLSLAACPLVLATVPAAPWLFHLLGHEAKVAAAEVAYYQVLAFGAGGTLISTVFSAFFIGLGRTGMVMIVDAIACIVNIVLDYALIFGCCGLPAWGIEGAAWATVAAQWLAVAVYWLILRRAPYHRTCRVAAGCRFDSSAMARILRFGGPNGLQFFLENTGMMLLLFVIGRLGEEAMVATNLAFNINYLVWLPIGGLGTAVATIVAQQLGRGKPELAARATWTAFSIAFTYTGLLGALYILAPDVFLIGHAAGVSPERFAELRSITTVLLQFVAAYCLFDAMNMIFASAIKGAGDTRFVLVTALLFSPMPVVASWLGVAWLGGGLIWCWSAVTVWACLLGTVYLARFLQGNWRNMRVIDIAGRAEFS
jgi:MATE family multidrug resistance protein